MSVTVTGLLGHMRWWSGARFPWSIQSNKSSRGFMMITSRSSKTLARIARSGPFLTFIRCISPTVKNPGNAVATQEEHQATFFAGKWITPGTRYGLKWNSLGVDLVTGTESLGRTEVTTLDIVMAIFQKVMNSSNHLMASNSAIGRRLHNVRSCLLRRSEHFLAIDNHFIWLLMIQKWTDTAFACSRSAIWSDNLFGMSHRCW